MASGFDKIIQDVIHDDISPNELEANLMIVKIFRGFQNIEQNHTGYLTHPFYFVAYFVNRFIYSLGTVELSLKKKCSITGCKTVASVTPCLKHKRRLV